jgi:hypothetical protein
MSSTINRSFDYDKSNEALPLEESIFGKHETSSSGAIADTSSIDQRLSQHKDRICKFCGAEFKGSKNKRYCNSNHRENAERRRVSSRLGIPARISKLDPLYFDME